MTQTDTWYATPTAACYSIQSISLHPRHFPSDILVHPQAAYILLAWLWVKGRTALCLANQCFRQGGGQIRTLRVCGSLLFGCAAWRRYLKAIIFYVPQLSTAWLYNTACLTWKDEPLLHKTVQIRHAAENKITHISVKSQCDMDLCSKWKSHMLTSVVSKRRSVLADFDRKYALNIMLAFI